jgi:arylsulfatase A-like enzyme
MRGRPLQSPANGDARGWSDDVFLQISESQVGRAVRTARWKYSVYAPDKDRVKDAGSDTYVEQFLYDLALDPHERVNLVADPSYRAVRHEMAERLRRRMAQAGEKVPEIRPAPAPGGRTP